MRGRAPLFILVLVACAVAVFLALASSALVPAVGQDGAKFIASGKDDKGRTCVSCHTTGYGQGGFESVEKTPKLTHVGCESCHGAGSLHQKAMLTAMATEEVPEDKKISKNVGCSGCHNPHISFKKKFGK